MSSLTTILISAGVSLVTALVTFQTRVWGDTVLLRKQHEWEQRKKLTKLVSKYHARLLEAAIDWDRRMSQAYVGEYRWLRLDPARMHRSHDQYFYHSMVYRFLNLLIVARAFEKEAVFIDARISDNQKELNFLRYAKSFIWAATNSDLTPRDDMPGRDHFSNDAFRALLDHGMGAIGEDQGGLTFTWSHYWVMVETSVFTPAQGDEGPDDHGSTAASGFDPRRNVGELLEFFLGLAPHEPREHGKEPRRRWDRLVCLHLLALGFIASFGYPWQKDAAMRSITRAVEHLSPDGVAAAAFVDNGADALGLSDQQGFQKIRHEVCARWRETLARARMAAALRREIQALEVRMSDLDHGVHGEPAKHDREALKDEVREKERHLEQLLYPGDGGDVPVRDQVAQAHAS